MKRIEIRNYRKFPAYKIEGLEAINVLVGPNDAGKTCLMKAIACLAGKGRLSTMDIALDEGPLYVPDLFTNQGTGAETTFWLRNEEGFVEATANDRTLKIISGPERTMRKVTIEQSGNAYVLGEPTDEDPVYLSNDFPWEGHQPRTARNGGAMADTMRLGKTIDDACSKGTTCLIENIERSLHWTKMLAMWRSTGQRIEQHGIQLFVTTHSRDCLLGLCLAAEENEWMEQNLCIHRIEPEGPPIPYGAPELKVAMRQGIEMR